MKFELLHPSDQIVMLMQRIYDFGMTTTSGGNISIRDRNGDIWITPGSIDKGRLNRRDIICVKPDGSTVGLHKPSIELTFHQRIYSVRPDVGAVIHAHPPGLVAFSAVGRLPNTAIIPSINLVCGKIDKAEYDIPGSAALGDKIADKFKEGNQVVVMENHGLVAVGDDVFGAFMRFETLEFCAKLEISALRLGEVTTLNKDQLALARTKQHVDMEEFVPDNHTSIEKDARREMCEIIKRAYRQRLFTSTQGTFSYKLDADSFLITPYGADRNYIDPVDIVRIDRDKKEKDKLPSRSVLLHRDIYKDHDDIKALIIAHPPNIMVYAISNIKFDSKMIPESYVMLRDIPVLPFGVNIAEPSKISQRLSASSPLVMVQNDCIVVSGDSLLQAFDRLEVAENTAMSLLNTAVLGEVKPINDKRLADLKRAFNLPD